MKVLLVNKFLYPKGGSETYVFEIGEFLQNLGHEVSYFGLNDSRNIVENSLKVGVDPTINPFKLIYSTEAFKKFEKLVLEFKPDIIHLNNINFQITPSVIDVAKKHNVPVVWTIHDPQLVCPNHRLFIEKSGSVCTKCVNGKIKNCVYNKCFDNSLLKSLIGYFEAKRYYNSKTYEYVSRFICPSEFMANMIANRFSKEKIIVLRNYCKFAKSSLMKKEDYILYYGRISEEKGIKTLLKSIPENINLIIAGKGPLENILNDLPENIKYVGFKTGEDLKELIRKAKFSIYPSEWYENCPFSILESISFGTPVIGSNIGGIPELIKDGVTGLLFEAGNADDLKAKIKQLYNNESLLNSMIYNAEQVSFDDIKEYSDKLVNIYNNVINGDINEKVNQ